MQAASRLVADQGWQYLEVPDVCWMDCSAPAAARRESGGREIVLCEFHALYLQAGCWDGDYSGAPLPPDSVAVSWPWRSLDTGQDLCLS